MQLVIILIHVVVCIALILIVLLQKGKGADMGAAFGGSSQTIFGSSGAASFLTKITAGAAIIFMLTSLALAFLFGKGATSSIMDGVSQPQAPVAQEAQQIPDSTTAPIAQEEGEGPVSAPAPVTQEGQQSPASDADLPSAEDLEKLKDME